MVLPPDLNSENILSLSFYQLLLLRRAIKTSSVWSGIGPCYRDIIIYRPFLFPKFLVLKELSLHYSYK